VSKAWAEDIQKTWPPVAQVQSQQPTLGNGDVKEKKAKVPSAVGVFEDWVPDATTGGLSLGGPDTDNSKLEVEIEETQHFLNSQSGALELSRKKAEAEAAKGKADRSAGDRRFDDDHRMDSAVMDHIGPVQFNMGGIQVDADDMVQRIKVSSS